MRWGGLETMGLHIQICLDMLLDHPTTHPLQLVLEGQPDEQLGVVYGSFPSPLPRAYQCKSRLVMPPPLLFQLVLEWRPDEEGRKQIHQYTDPSISDL